MSIREKHRHLTREEMTSIFTNGSRLAPLVLPLFRPDYQRVSESLARELSGAFLWSLLVEGDAAIEYITHLPEEQKSRLHEILKLGGIEDVSYYSKLMRIVVSEL